MNSGAARRWSFVLLAALGCSGDDALPTDDPVLATFEGGTVTQSEVDEVMRSLPTPPVRTRDREADWQENLLREVAVRELLLAAARSSSVLELPEVRKALAEIERQAYATACVAARAPRLPPLTDAELEAAFERSRAAYESPERRQVYHLFKRVTAGADGAAQLAEIAALRRRLLAGERIEALAAVHSDSETRHREGILGWFARGQLDARLEDVVFALPERTPSEPIRTTTGVHLLWVEAIEPATAPTLDEVRDQVREGLERQRRLEHIRSLTRSAPPEGSFLPSDEELRTLFAAGDPETLLLDIGDFQFTLLDLRRRLAEMGAGQRGPVDPVQVVQAVAVLELFAAQCREEGFELGAAAARQVELLREATLAASYAREELVEEVLRDRATLEQFYERNQLRFSDPLRLHLEQAEFPLGAEPNRTMARLEAERDRLDTGAVTLAELAAELGGTIEDLGWKRLSELQALSPTLALLASPLAPGRHASPFRHREGLVVLHLLERREPTPLPLGRVEQRVAEEYLGHQGQQLYARLTERLLADHGFRVADSRDRAGP